VAPAGPQGDFGDELLVLEGAQAGAALGSALAGADVNGDGFEDLLVASPGHDGAWPNEGRIDLHLGSAQGLASTPS